MGTDGLSRARALYTRSVGVFADLFICVSCCGAKLWVLFIKQVSACIPDLTIAACT